MIVKAEFGVYEIEHTKNLPDSRYILERKGVYLLSDCGKKKVGFVRHHTSYNLSPIRPEARAFKSIDVLYIRDSIFPNRELSLTPPNCKEWVDSLDEGVVFIIDCTEKDLEAYQAWLFH
jgi:hypothetical protein